MGGRLLPKGILVAPAIALLHLRPDIYPEPHAFRPERFLDGQPEPYTWVPFGGGVRRCLGAAFATFEMKVVLRAVLARTRLSAAHEAPERAQIQHITVVPHRDAEVVLEERLPAAPGPSAEPLAAAMASPVG
jgi:cytochrome P450